MVYGLFLNKVIFKEHTQTQANKYRTFAERPALVEQWRVHADETHGCPHRLLLSRRCAGESDVKRHEKIHASSYPCM